MVQETKKDVCVCKTEQWASRVGLMKEIWSLLETASRAGNGPLGTAMAGWTARGDGHDSRLPPCPPSPPLPLLGGRQGLFPREVPHSQGPGKWERGELKTEGATRRSHTKRESQSSSPQNASSQASCLPLRRWGPWSEWLHRKGFAMWTLVSYPHCSSMPGRPARKRGRWHKRAHDGEAHT